MAEDLLHDLELELAPLFLGKAPQSTRFIHALNELLASHPELLDYALEVPIDRAPRHFLIIFFQKVFHFAMVYQHRAYSPWYPRDEEQLKKTKQLLDLHFPSSAERLSAVFERLLRGTKPGEKLESVSASQQTNAQQTEQEGVDKAPLSIARRQRKTPPKMPMTMEELPVTEDAIQPIWAAARSASETEWPSEFLNSFSSSPRGVIDSMRATFKLFTAFQASEQRAFTTRAGDKLRPWMRMVRMIIGAEYYWQSNKRSVETDPGVNLAEANRVHQDHIHRVYEEFLRLLPEDHEATWEQNRRDWRLERIRGTKQASRVICRYVDNDFAFTVECSQNNISAKEVRLAQTTQEDEAPIKSFNEEIMTDVIIRDEPDPGIRDDVLLALYLAKSEEPRWPNNTFPEDIHPWFKAMLNSLHACWALYSTILRSRTRSREAEGYSIQPQHKIVRLLCAAEYFWQFNHRDIELSREMGFHEMRDLHNGNVRNMVEIFLDAIPEQHPWQRTQEAQLGTGAWKVERMRGARRAPRVLVKYTDENGDYLMEISATSVSVKQMEPQT